jgi:cysteine desulfuration protein SufE
VLKGQLTSLNQGHCMNIASRIQNIVNQFKSYEQWEDRYRDIIKIGKELPGMNDEDKIDKYRIKGCQSQVWLKPELKDGKMYLLADSDAVLVKGIVGLLVKVYSEATPAEVLGNKPDFLSDIGITEHLSMNRTNGLASMVKQLQMYAMAFEALLQKGVTDANP